MGMSAIESGPGHAKVNKVVSSRMAACLREASKSELFEVQVQGRLAELETEVKDLRAEVHELRHLHVVVHELQETVKSLTALLPAGAARHVANIRSDAPDTTASSAGRGSVGGAVTRD